MTTRRKGEAVEDGGMGVRDLAFVGAMLGGLVLLAGGAVRPREATTPTPTAPGRAPTAAVVAEVDRAFRDDWAALGVEPAPPAPELAVLRRLHLALTGSIPSLAEVRRFEAMPAGGRLDAWVDALLADRRSADYLAERLTRAFVGTEDGPFLLFRRRRFRSWLSDAILENRPYDAVVRDLIAASGLWTDRPATNFLTATFDPESERPDPERVAARVSRSMLGVRLDCAQCHDHPFQPWTQSDFRGLAAFFGGVRSDLRGLRDDDMQYRPPAPKTREPAEVEPAVPFHPDLLPPSGPPRGRLAAWAVDPANPHLARATANRAWALLFRRPLSEPVDDLPPEGEQPEALRLLADDFAAHGYDFHRLIRVIAATAAFRLDTALPEGSGSGEAHEAAWAAFPMTRLRPEQVAGSILQCRSLAAFGPAMPWFVRLDGYEGVEGFVGRFGDAGEDEFEPRGGTIPQQLLLMNGELVRDSIRDDLFLASSRIAGQAPDDRSAVEVAYLTVLTRRPGPDELDHFLARLAGTAGQDRKERLTDMFWTLINSAEFSWNH